ncbi:MAG: transposase, partial [Fimbriimonadales bacterium]
MGHSVGGGCVVWISGAAQSGALEQAGWSPVARASSRLRARAEAHPEVLRGRYRIEQVFGSVKGAYGSSVSSRSWRGARCWVWGILVL